MEEFFGGKVRLFEGDCRESLKGIPDCSIDSGVMDPPYALVSIGKRFGKESAKLPSRGGPMENVYNRTARGFMGQDWDTGETAFAAEFWSEVYRVLKPGAHIAIFGGTRTFHRLACAIEDVGFEIRDQLAWVYGSGFPKSHDVSKGIDKKLGGKRSKVRVDAADLKNPPNLVGGAIKGDDRPWRKEALRVGYHEVDSDTAATPQAAQWQGWGTALKPAWEPICLARKPLDGTVAENVLEHGTGAINIDGCRVEGGDAQEGRSRHGGGLMQGSSFQMPDSVSSMPAGRWPANIIHDGSDEAASGFPIDEFGISAARYFYTPKADGNDRLGSKHPTVKPLDLMRWLCRLITPPGGVVLDCFAGTGTTGEAAWREGFSAIIMERNPPYLADIRKRMKIAPQHSTARKLAASKPDDTPAEHHDIFGGTE